MICCEQKHLNASTAFDKQRFLVSFGIVAYRYLVEFILKRSSIKDTRLVPSVVSDRDLVELKMNEFMAMFNSIFCDGLPELQMIWCIPLWRNHALDYQYF